MVIKINIFEERYFNQGGGLVASRFLHARMSLDVVMMPNDSNAYNDMYPTTTADVRHDMIQK